MDRQDDREDGLSPTSAHGASLAQPTARSVALAELDRFSRAERVRQGVLFIGVPVAVMTVLWFAGSAAGGGLEVLVLLAGFVAFATGAGIELCVRQLSREKREKLRAHVLELEGEKPEQEAKLARIRELLAARRS